MITRAQFKKLIWAIQDEHKRIDEIEKFIEKYSDSYVVFKRTLIDDIIAFLEDYFCKDSDYISWWLFEDIDKQVWENGVENPATNVENIDDFYDFLIREKTRNEGEKQIW